MERLIRIVNDDDRHALAWLTTHAGQVRVADAARHLAHAGRPVFVSALCRYLGMWPPARREPVRAAQDSALADRHLAQIRRILAGAATATTAAISPPPPVVRRGAERWGATAGVAGSCATVSGTHPPFVCPHAAA